MKRARSLHSAYWPGLIVPCGKMIMSTMSDTKNTATRIMVMRSRFFSTMLVPWFVPYTLEAIISETPVPLPECNRMKIMSPMPERTSKTEKMIASTDKLIPYLIRFMPYKTLIMTNSLLLFKKRFCGHFAR